MNYDGKQRLPERLLFDGGFRSWWSRDPPPRLELPLLQLFLQPAEADAQRGLLSQLGSLLLPLTAGLCPRLRRGAIGSETARRELLR